MCGKDSVVDTRTGMMASRLAVACTCSAMSALVVACTHTVFACVSNDLAPQMATDKIEAVAAAHRKLLSRNAKGCGGWHRQAHDSWRNSRWRWR